MKVNEIIQDFAKLDPRVQSRIKIEVKVLKSVIERVLATGNWRLDSVDDGGDEVTKVTTVKEALEVVFGVDDARIWFQCTVAPERPLAYVYAVLGNDGWDVVNDWSISPHGFDEAVEAATNVNDNGDEEV
jgi:hypothetical protein